MKDLSNSVIKTCSNLAPNFKDIYDWDLHFHWHLHSKDNNIAVLMKRTWIAPAGPCTKWLLVCHSLWVKKQSFESLVEWGKCWLFYAVNCFSTVFLPHFPWLWVKRMKLALTLQKQMLQKCRKLKHWGAQYIN